MITKKEIEEFSRLGDKLLSHFDCEYLWDYPEIMTHVWWAHWDGCICWWMQEPLDDHDLDNPDYREKAIKLADKNDYALAALTNCSTILLDSKKRKR